MPTKAARRETAIEATEATCPRCGAPREPDQRYCLECGLALPGLDGAVPGLRRRWVRRFGWYPGDWVWVSLLTLLVAAAGAAVAIVLTHHTASGASGQTFQATSSVVEPPVVPTTTPAVTSTLPVTPVPTTKTKTTAPTTTRATPKPKPRTAGGLFTWPAHANGWTIVLVSYPSTDGLPQATATAAKATSAGLKQVGVLDSSDFASLQPGYDVVFTGVYGSQAAADASVGTARAAGFGGAYSRQIAR